jgi:adenylate cyclase class IV
MDLKPESFFEIELKALLDKNKHAELDKLLEQDQKFKHFNTESIRTSFFKDPQRNDVRLRISDKTCELVYKKGLVREFCRKEIKIPLANKEKLDYLMEIFNNLQINPERGTLKHKKEYIYHYKGYDYIVCLQHLEDFAYLLEVEFLADTEEEAEIHVPNIKEIITELELKVIDGDKFMERIYDYISGETTINYPVV